MKDRCSPSRTSLVAFGMLVLLMYFICSGPAMPYLWKSDSGVLQTGVWIVYFPLIWLASASESFRAALVWYVELWNPEFKLEFYS